MPGDLHQPPGRGRGQRRLHAGRPARLDEGPTGPLPGPGDQALHRVGGVIRPLLPFKYEIATKRNAKVIYLKILSLLKRQN